MLKTARFFGDTWDVASTRALSRAPWSASKVQMALRCAREFYYRYVDKVPEIEVMPDARIGKAIHLSLERVLQGTPLRKALAAGRGELANEYEQARFDSIGTGIRPFLDRVSGFRQRRSLQRQMVEFNLAVREDFTATKFYAGDAYYRGVFDVGFIYDDDKMAIVDHKTGLRISSRRVAEQLEGYAVLASASFREVQRFRLGVHWVADAEIEWSREVTHADIYQHFLPSVIDNIEAAALAVDDGPRPSPGAWCGRCGYRSICPEALGAQTEPVDDEEPDPGLQ